MTGFDILFIISIIVLFCLAAFLGVMLVIEKKMIGNAQEQTNAEVDREVDEDNLTQRS